MVARVLDGFYIPTRYANSHADSPPFEHFGSLQSEAALRAWSDELRRSRPKAARVGYFGSYSRGDWGVGSDLDVLLQALCVPSGIAWPSSGCVVAVCAVVNECGGVREPRLSSRIPKGQKPRDQGIGGLRRSNTAPDGDQHLALDELGDEAEHVALYGGVLGRERPSQLCHHVGGR